MNTSTNTTATTSTKTNNTSATISLDMQDAPINMDISTYTIEQKEALFQDYMDCLRFEIQVGGKYRKQAVAMYREMQAGSARTPLPLAVTKSQVFALALRSAVTAEII